MSYGRLAFALPFLAALPLACFHRLPPPPPRPPPPLVPAAEVPAPHIDATLTARKVLFDNPDHGDARISPDGKRIAWLAPVQGVMNVWVGAASDVSKGQAVTHDTSGGIRWWWWGFDSDRVVYARNVEGADAVHLWVVDLTKGEPKDLTPIEGVRADLVMLSAKRPHEALVSINDRDKKFADVYLVDLTTAARKMAAQNDGGYAAWIADEDLRVRFARRETADGATDYLQLGHGKEPPKEFLHVPLEDARTVEILGFDKSGDVVLLKDSRNRDTSALLSLDTKTLASTRIADDAAVDVGQVLIHPTTHVVEAVSYNRDRQSWSVVDASVEGDFYYLQTFGGDATISVTSRSLDEQHWLVAFETTDGPTLYYRYDRDPDVPGAPGKASFLFRSKDGLEHVKLSAMKPVTIKSRDGLDLGSYLTIPYDQDPRDEGRPKKPVPTVLLVHDGPWARASLAYSPWHQWLASRGYAVLGVNYRGSMGFGKKFLNSGNLEWGGKMQDDLADAAKWVVDQKIADPAKVAILGEGYGGFAALAGMAGYPFACAVDMGGPSSLMSFAQSASPRGQPQVEEIARRVGDWRTEDGKRLLADRSPWTHAERIKRPVLVEQGKLDGRVPEGETEELVTAIRTNRIPVTYVVYPDEGHRLSSAANRTSFTAVADAFLARCLEGPYEPIGQDFVGSTVTVPVGASYVPGLREALHP